LKKSGFKRESEKKTARFNRGAQNRIFVREKSMKSQSTKNNEKNRKTELQGKLPRDEREPVGNNRNDGRCDRLQSFGRDSPDGQRATERILRRNKLKNH